MKTLADLKSCVSISELREALLEICTNFGPVQRLEILKAAHEGRHQVICFLSLSTLDQELELMRSMGVGRFDDQVVFVVDLEHPPEDEAPDSSAEWSYDPQAAEPLDKRPAHERLQSDPNLKSNLP